MAEEPTNQPPRTVEESASEPERVPGVVEQDTKGVLGGLLAGLGCLGFISLPLLIIGFVLLFVLALWGINELYQMFFA